MGWVASSVDATGAPDKTEGGLDLFASYLGDECARRSQCVFSVLKSLMNDRQRDTIEHFLPEQVDAWFHTA